MIWKVIGLIRGRNPSITSADAAMSQPEGRRIADDPLGTRESGDWRALTVFILCRQMVELLSQPCMGSVR